MRAAAGEFILEGLYAHKRISRNEELAFIASERTSREERRDREPREEYWQRGAEGRRGGGRRNLN